MIDFVDFFACFLFFYFCVLKINLFIKLNFILKIIIYLYIYIFFFLFLYEKIVDIKS
jgi:hypothetical protein